MKYKHAAILLSISLGTTALFGCSQSQTSSGTGTEEETLYGEITEIGDDTITIELGTRKEMPDGEGKPDMEEQSDMEMPSMLELTGETKEIGITEETELTRGGMRQGGGPGKETPDGTVPDMQEEEIEFSDLEVGDVVTITAGKDGKADRVSVMSMGMGGGMDAAAVESYTAVKEYTQDTEVDGEEIKPRGDVTGASVQTAWSAYEVEKPGQLG